MDALGRTATAAPTRAPYGNLHANPRAPAPAAPGRRPDPSADRIDRSDRRPLGLHGFQRTSGGERTLRRLALDAPVAAGIVRNVGGAYPSLDLRAIERGGAGRPHTLQRHVGKSDVDLRERLATEPVPASSTYTDLASAQRATDFVIGTSQNQAKIEMWLENGAKGTQLLDAAVPGAAIGRVLSRADAATGRGAVASSDAQVVLKADSNSPSGYTVLSSYPTKP